MQGIDQKTYLDVFEQKLYSLTKLIQDLQRGLPAPRPEQFLKGLDLIIRAVETFLRLRVKSLQARFAGKPQELADQIEIHAKVALRILGSLHQQYLPLLHAETQSNEYLFKRSIDEAVGLFTNSGFGLQIQLCL